MLLGGPLSTDSSRVKDFRGIYMHVRAPPLWILPFWDAPQFLAPAGAPNSNLRDLSPIRSLLSVPALSPSSVPALSTHTREFHKGKACRCGFLLSSFILPPVSVYFFHFPKFSNNCFSLFCPESIIAPTGELIQCKLFYHAWKSKVQNIFYIITHGRKFTGN